MHKHLAMVQAWKSERERERERGREREKKFVVVSVVGLCQKRRRRRRRRCDADADDAPPSLSSAASDCSNFFFVFPRIDPHVCTIVLLLLKKSRDTNIRVIPWRWIVCCLPCCKSLYRSWSILVKRMITEWENWAIILRWESGLLMVWVHVSMLEFKQLWYCNTTLKGWGSAFWHTRLVWNGLVAINTTELLSLPRCRMTGISKGYNESLQL